MLDNGAILLNGSDPMNEWVDDPAATRPGILPFDQQPQLERDDYVFNANDSHWLANPAQLLTGYSPLTGAEGVPQTSRTRENAILLADPTLRGDDGKFNLATSCRPHGSPTARCTPTCCATRSSRRATNRSWCWWTGMPFDITPGCDVLRNWDGRLNNDSKGAVLWREFLIAFTRADRGNAGDLYAVPFDPADPVGTPNTMAAEADHQQQPRRGDGRRCSRRVGRSTSRWATCSSTADRSTETDPDPGRHQPGGRHLDRRLLQRRRHPGTEGRHRRRCRRTSFTTKGYPVTFGNSFVMTLEFTDDGPRAEAILTYGQPDDPDEPRLHLTDQALLEQELRPVLFTAEAVADGAVGEPVTVTGERP